MTLYVMRGYSGSGKSTIAAGLDAEVVSRDLIRTALTGRIKKFAGDGAFEAKVTVIERSMIRSLLGRGLSVVVDDTNLNPELLRLLLDIAVEAGVEWSIWDVTTPLDECLRRNRERESPVPEKVIRRQAARYPMPWPDVQPRIDYGAGVQAHAGDNRPPAVIVDVDGTLAHAGAGWSPYDPGHYSSDTVDPMVKRVVRALAETHSVLVVSGREGTPEAEKVTRKWLKDHQIPVDGLYMRPEGEGGHDATVKARIFDQLIEPHFDVRLVLDDRDRVVNMWRWKGLKTFQVEKGDF